MILWANCLIKPDSSEDLLYTMEQIDKFGIPAFGIIFILFSGILKPGTRPVTFLLCALGLFGALALVILLAPIPELTRPQLLISILAIVWGLLLVKESVWIVSDVRICANAASENRA